MELEEYKMADLIAENARYRMALEAVEAMLDTRTAADTIQNVVTAALKEQVK